MKKCILGGIAVLAFAAIVGLNVKMNVSDNKMENLSIANVEALAGEGISDWWDSKTHDCVAQTCSFSVNLLIVSWTNYGTNYGCRDGSSVAHCWDCDGCDA